MSVRALPAAVALAVLLAGACGAPERESVAGKRTVVVGVRPDLPGLGLRLPDGGFEGYDVDVARYLVRKLGAGIRLIPVLAAERERVLLDGRADLVLATFSVTQERKSRVAFAGPYHVSYQDIMVRADREGIAGVRDLEGKGICAVEGSNAAERVVEERGVKARLVPAADYDRCVALLKEGELDAITTNDVILAGLAAREKGRLRLVNARFNEQRTGVGIRKGDLDGCEAINRAITDMYQDGTAARLIAKWFDGTGLDLTSVHVPRFEGCE
ncbi:transporter substrate-binding domain-containing protein [Sphaerisporangium sp. TRM90804]|uniref:transporter substrate-binding domain-containing protein n=1 Tax=Sphaerisporangium sp. TRM90804 TaxID=3031113 RepID=UPI00244AB12A|nr:transporter substrate-binding domain-containing protein [Sphaerisporangium sp. TRM90804]MDH2427724.1 transporter substrate-binding domain-containing protein [Sphaerisporangium sp. TRM90804]